MEIKIIDSVNLYIAKSLKKHSILPYALFLINNRVAKG